jgi:vacuolar-type H+-ATPase subunit E/Vma4
MDGRFDKFSATVVKEAMDEKDCLVKGYREENEAFLKKSQTEITKANKKKIRGFIRNVRSKKDFALARRRNELRRDLFEAREKMFEEMMTELEGKLEEFKKSPQYAVFLAKKLTAASKMLDFTPSIVCECDDDDVDKMSEIFKQNFPTCNVRVEAIQSKTLGGFLLKNIEKGLILDASMDSDVEAQKVKFFEVSGLSFKDS